jgi:hypothetical protein
MNDIDMYSEHTCADWKALDTWAAERSFSAYDQKSLVHPQLGKGTSSLYEHTPPLISYLEIKVLHFL